MSCLILDAYMMVGKLNSSQDSDTPILYQRLDFYFHPMILNTWNAWAKEIKGPPFHNRSMGNYVINSFSKTR